MNKKNIHFNSLVKKKYHVSNYIIIVLLASILFQGYAFADILEKGKGYYIEGKIFRAPAKCSKCGSMIYGLIEYCPRCGANFANYKDYLPSNYKIVITTKKQEIIAKIAKNNKNSSVRLAAVKMLKDQALLKKIVKSDPEAYVRKYAVKRLFNQDVLAEAARYDPDEGVRKEAVKKLKRKKDLEEIAQNDKSKEIRQYAKAKLERLLRRTNK